MKPHKFSTPTAKNPRIFLYPELIDRNLECPVCLKVYESPTRLTCAHSFCYKCIKKWSDTARHKVCPLCKSLFKEGEFLRDGPLEAKVGDLMVKCQF